MARARRRSSAFRPDNRRRTERVARLSETLREVIADELARIDDDRLSLVSITSVDVDSEMNRGIVYFDSMTGEDGDAEIVAALGEHRKRLQSEIARQVQSRRTPVLQFAPDESIRAAARIDELLRRDAERHRTSTDE